MFTDYSQVSAAGFRGLGIGLREHGFLAMLNKAYGLATRK